jgi:hypothetical protein
MALNLYSEVLCSLGVILTSHFTREVVGPLNLNH